jgi:hypothetical protein
VFSFPGAFTFRFFLFQPFLDGLGMMINSTTLTRLSCSDSCERMVRVEGPHVGERDSQVGRSDVHPI